MNAVDEEQPVERQWPGRTGPRQRPVKRGTVLADQRSCEVQATSGCESIHAVWSSKLSKVSRVVRVQQCDVVPACGVPSDVASGSGTSIRRLREQMHREDGGVLPPHSLQRGEGTALIGAGVIDQKDLAGQHG